MPAQVPDGDARHAHEHAEHEDDDDDNNEGEELSKAKPSAVADKAKKKEKTTEEKAQHAAWMRMSRSLKSLRAASHEVAFRMCFVLG